MSLILLDLTTLLKIISNPINWATIVATPIPVIPIAGIKPYPKINSGFKPIFRKKLKISTFL